MSASVRELVVLGTSSITRICLTHLHGDQCLGLPGVLQRLALDGLARGVDLYYPAGGQEYVERLRRASATAVSVEVREHPVSQDGTVHEGPGFVLEARALDHRVDTFGYRLAEPDGRRMLPATLAVRSVTGPDVGRLQREGEVVVDGRPVRLEEVSEPRPARVFAFVMDTRPCPNAAELARGADLLVCEATYLSAEARLAASYAHLTPDDAGRMAAEAGARRLVLTHFPPVRRRRALRGR